MKETYSIPEYKRQDVEKLIARYHKKAIRYGCEMSVEYGRPYTKKIPVYKNDPITHTQYKVDDVMIECFDLSIDGDIIRKGEYQVVAMIEHLENGNIVSMFEDHECNPAWNTTKAHCEHCNCNHNQVYTFIVEHNGMQKQVGRTCLKDYSGIDPQMIGVLNELNCITLDDNVGMDYEMVRDIPKVYDTIEILALAIMIQKKQGYVPASEPESNKAMIRKCLSEKVKADDESMKEASQMGNIIVNMSDDEIIKGGLNNVQVMLRYGNCKESNIGHIACAPMMFERFQKRHEKRDSERSHSNYVGEIGKRMIINVCDMALLTSWENMYGRTYLYKFTDDSGNILVWFASKAISATKQIKATIKEHKEKDGVKQTIITRCTVL